MTSSRRGAVLLLVGTFVVGALLGGVVTTLADRPAHKRQRPPRPSYVERLAAELGLSDAQRDSVQAVLERHQPAMDSLWQRVRPLFQSERQAVRNEITLHLNPEQQAKFTEMQRQDSIRRAESDRNRNGRR